MYKYTICNGPDEEIFVKQCKALEKHIPGLTKEELLTDVDETKIQQYKKDGKSIWVYNDYYQVKAVYIESEIELMKYFQ